MFPIRLLLPIGPRRRACRSAVLLLQSSDVRLQGIAGRDAELPLIRSGGCGQRQLYGGEPAVRERDACTRIKRGGVQRVSHAIQDGERDRIGSDVVLQIT